MKQSDVFQNQKVKHTKKKKNKIKDYRAIGIFQNFLTNITISFLFIHTIQ